MNVLASMQAKMRPPVMSESYHHIVHIVQRHHYYCAVEVGILARVFLFLLVRTKWQNVILLLYMNFETHQIYLWCVRAPVYIIQMR